ncbi:Na(+)-translocating NADH-quinone reductase subunit A [Mangrovibacterium diazotrophicum]|uniref:Na(+)-translocating NADH-quinone reductase subunit A n=1 Tax=Mangrovibacterium diazotrophicum TaxID=1261403 RepID=A0A419VV18_9BACT|nr:Na(+)-translocating NADH-quinone reductase subunit A [Mangrovibacterium diazotrophicum]RKD85961.1 Na+-transporting NADH:ubiquinone oxidoreductase subunit A [Mangrovibacterium diazotrophicum]
MSKHFKLKRGLDIRLKGAAEATLEVAPAPVTVALKPIDFPGLTPKLSVKADAQVKAGDALFFDKYNPEILFTSPVSGTVKAVNRGERRKILEVIVEADGKNEFVSFSQADPLKLSREKITEQLLTSGLWPFFKQRPYGTLAKPSDQPKNIFISGFDSSPLAPDYEFIFKNDISAIQTGINALSKLTDGKVYFGLPGKVSNSIFAGLKNAELNTFSGPHPAGNVGIQIHKVAPVNKGEVVWTISVQAVAFIGRLFETGKLDLSKTIALAGSEVKAPKYVKTIQGALVGSLVKGKTKQEGNERIISGTVLTGTKVEADDYLGFYDQQISVIPEGDHYEFMGWAEPGFGKYSASKAFFSSLFPKKEYVLDANMNGSERAYVVTGQYEKFLPMDILPVYLIKAILANDIDKMEQLGIYEVVEEDLALCEYACTSKIKVQEILRQGLDVMVKEVG